MKILIVDDSRKHREAALTQLEALGHEVVIMSGYTELLRKRSVLKEQSFDVALIDLLMPAESMTLGERGMEHLGQEIMVGYPLSIFLAMSGVPRVAVVTDTNHHDHPASAIMDHLSDNVVINGACVVYLHAKLTKENLKDWAAALKEVLR